MSAKRIFMIGSVLALLLSVAVIRHSMQPAIGWQVFEERMPAIFETSGLRILSAITEESETLPLPYLYQLRDTLKSRWIGINVAAESGFLDSVLHLTLYCI